MAAILLGALVQFKGGFVWDDAYMFVRYTDSLLSDGVIGFNADQSPTYGLTALGYLVVVLPIRTILPGNPALTIALSSLISGLFFLGSILWLAPYWSGPQSPAARRAIWLVLLFSLAYAARGLTNHFVNGMDAMFVLSYLTLYLYVARRHEATATPRGMIATGILGGVAFLVRPDLMVFTMLLPLAGALLGADGHSRRMARGTLLITSGTLALIMLLNTLYFETPAPLPFFAKTQGIYGPTIESVYRDMPALQMKRFVFAYPLLISLIVVGLAANPMGWWRKSRPSDKGLLAACALFGGYYLFFVLQVMGEMQRFYYPLLPGLMLLAAGSLVQIWQRHDFDHLSRSARRAARAAAALAMSFMLWDLAQWELAELGWLARNPRSIVFDMERQYDGKGRGYWFCLDGLAALPDDLVLATTEVGQPGVMMPGHRVVDLAGLNEPSIAFGGFVAEEFFEQHHPDVIYMPHPHYREMIDEMLAAPAFAAYEHHPAEALDTEMGLAIRRDSPHYAAVRELVGSGCNLDSGPVAPAVQAGL